MQLSILHSDQLSSFCYCRTCQLPLAAAGVSQHGFSPCYLCQLSILVTAVVLSMFLMQVVSVSMELNNLHLGQLSGPATAGGIMVFVGRQVVVASIEPSTLHLATLAA